MFEALTMYAAWGVFAVRFVFGFIFATHGSQKLFGGLTGTTQFFEQIKIKPAKFFATLVGVIEFAGGIAMMLGLYTRVVALLLAIIMIVALVKVKIKQGFVQGYEFDLLLLVTACMFILVGAGTLSLDYILL